MQREQQVRELKAAMYPENRYLQSKICVHLSALVKNKNKTVSTEAKKLLDRANLLDEPYSFNKDLVRPENIPQLFDVYDETITLIEKHLLP